MFEHKTFENILGDMLTYVTGRNPDLDTRTGSVIYTALAPIALELETAYHEMDMILEETFLETASKEYLVKHGNQLGLNLNEATYGHFRGEFNVPVEIGSRFNLDKFNYSVISKLADPSAENPHYAYELVCETAGTEPNDYFGDLTPITFVANLEYANLTSIIIHGEDEEETEAYRYRLQIHIKNPPIDGNVAQYDEWLSEYDGIGKYRTIPCWNGKNTVKLVILNPEQTTASPELITQVQNYFDPPTSDINDNPSDAAYPQGRGMGNGKAPIGAVITVDTAIEVPVTVNCRVRLKDGYSDSTGVAEAVDNYLKSIVLTDDKISYMSIAGAIFNAECVKDISSLTVTVENTVMNPNLDPYIPSVYLNDNEIPVLDTANSTWRP